MLPGMLLLIVGFFALLHSWMNAFAEMTRFADRMFYRVSATIYVFMFISRLLYFLKVLFSYLSREKGTK